MSAAAGYWRKFTRTAYFDEPCQLTGTLVCLDEQKTTDGLVPKLTLRLDDGAMVVVVASQARLRAALIEQQPATGDRVRITYTGEAKRAAKGFSPAKEFVVEVRRAEQPAGARPGAAEDVPENGPRAGAAS